ncbi:MAG TPA: MarR family transcriptional regulator [Caldimonas sp.]|jgi:DNA-binding MarR family transcriptional regulator|nr:MarR family transcriptional regulator [Caldimonas sp.]HEX4235131.1 MarR family transcriptional regulator [Caldimonas sp.]
MDRLQQFGFLLKDLSRRYVARFEAHAHEISLTLVQCKALVTLERNEGVSQARLAELTDVDPMTMVRILDHMEGEGLLERRADPDDRRARRLFLSDKAKPSLAEIWRVAEATRNETFAGISRVDRDAFMNVLEKLHANALAFGDLDDAAPAPRARRASA